MTMYIFLATRKIWPPETYNMIVIWIGRALLIAMHVPGPVPVYICTLICTFVMSGKCMIGNEQQWMQLVAGTD